MTKPKFDESQVRDAAYFLWLEEGQPQGRDQAHWQKAVDALNAKPAKAKPARKAPAKKAPVSAAAKTNANPKAKATPATKKAAARKPAKGAKT